MDIKYMATLALLVGVSLIGYYIIGQEASNEDDIVIARIQKTNNTECQMVEYVATNADILFRLIMEDTKKNKIPMRVLTLSRCFNTVFVILSFLLGYSQTNDIIQYCWDEVQDFKINVQNVQTLIDKINKNKNSKGRFLYFVSINAFGMRHSQNQFMQSVFPGHVFLVEQVYVDNKVKYKFYQSYINDFTLKNYMYKVGFDITYDAFIHKMKRLKEFYEYGDIWTNEHRQIWKEISTVDTGDQYIGYNIDGMKFCSYVKEIEKSICYHNVVKLVEKFLKLIDEKENSIAVYLKTENNKLYAYAENDNEKHIIDQMFADFEINGGISGKSEAFENQYTKMNEVNNTLKEKLNEYYRNIQHMMEDEKYYSNVFKIKSVYDTDGITTEELKTCLLEMKNELKNQFY